MTTAAEIVQRLRERSAYMLQLAQRQANQPQPDRPRRGPVVNKQSKQQG